MQQSEGSCNAPNEEPIHPSPPQPACPCPHRIPAAHPSASVPNAPEVRRTSAITSRKNREQPHSWLLAMALCYAMIRSDIRRPDLTVASNFLAAIALRALFSMRLSWFSRLEACESRLPKAMLPPPPPQGTARGRWPFPADPDARLRANHRYLRLCTPMVARRVTCV